MSSQNPFLRFYNFLANMGLVIRDDPPKVIDLTGREWGEPAGDLELSIRELPREDAREVSGISAVLRNTADQTKSYSIPPWTHFYRVDGLELTPYGRQVLNSEGKRKTRDVTIAPGEAIETELPLSSMYNVRGPGEYEVQVAATLPDGTELRSNRIRIRAGR